MKVTVKLPCHGQPVEVEVATHAHLGARVTDARCRRCGVEFRIETQPLVVPSGPANAVREIVSMTRIETEIISVPAGPAGGHAGRYAR